MMEMCNEYIAIQKKNNLHPTLKEFLKRCGDLAPYHPYQKRIIEFTEERKRLIFNGYEGRGNWNNTPLDIKPIHGPSDAMGSAIIEAQKMERNIYSNMIAFSEDPSRNIRGRSSEFMWFDEI
jgi:hypothetical protein